MEKPQLLRLVADPEKLVEAITAVKPLHDEKGYKDYHPENHKVFDVVERPKKEINKPTGRKDDKGTEIVEQATEEVVRIAIPAQKLIVSRAVIFTAGAPVELYANPETEAEKQLLKMVRKVWNDNKMDYKNLPIAETMMSEREALEVWNIEDAKPGYWKDLAPKSLKRLRMMIIKPSDGNKLYPQWNTLRDLIGLARVYKVGEGAEKQQYLDLYTDERVYCYKEVDGKWFTRDDVKDEESSNLIGKMPLVYYAQARFEWQDVDTIIARLETLLSNHGDINDYNGSPAIVASGKIMGFSSKGERGKAFELDKGATLQYLSWDAAPESIKMEIDNLLNAVYTYTQTPNISFEAVKGIGVQSGVAIKLLFMDAHSKARRKQFGDYGESIQRRINLIKAACVKLNPMLKDAEGMEIAPVFSDYMPTNELEQAQITNYNTNSIMQANGGKAFLSRETSYTVNPFNIEDTAEEKRRIEEEEEKEAMTGDNNTGRVIQA